MQTEIAVALLSLIGTLAGSAGGILISNRLTNYRIEQLEKRVEQLAAIDSRVSTLEARMEMMTK